MLQAAYLTTFPAEPQDIKVELQDQFIDLQNDEESKVNVEEG